tara:strand:- start:8278 stop:9279 length:1002 start_codon:yes stop_codon:yes gene_type:complete
MILAKFFIGIIAHHLINKILLKKKLLLDDPKYSSHKNFVNINNNIVLSGGTVFLLLFIFFCDASIGLLLFIFFIFFIGIISDLKILNLPSLRFLLQFLIISFFVYTLDLGVSSTDLKYLDIFLKNKYISLLFSVFCILVLINGSNFFDGLNTLTIGYYVLVFSSIIILIKIFNISYDVEFLINIILILSVILLFNLLNKSFLGDSGAYAVSCLAGYVCIDFYNYIKDLSVLFIVVILWYPAFETLFSIIRKLQLRYNPTKPDNNHLHHYFYIFLKKKIKNNYQANLIAANLINLYNLIIFGFSIFFYKNSFMLSIILLINLIVYLSSYKILKK